MNSDKEAARRYHEATSHTRASVRGGPGLDWDNRPHPFKEYVGLAPEPLPADLERLLRWGGGVVRTRSYPGDLTYHFRTYSSAGALYPIEVYAATAEGLFHFHPLELAVRGLRTDDVRGALALAADDAPLSQAEAVLVLTGILWRTAWKYGARGYRHLWWDAGTMVANLLALAHDARLLTGFVDDAVNRIMGVDGEREAALCLLAVDGRPAREEARVYEHNEAPVEPLSPEVAPLSRAERAYPVAVEVHRESRLATAEDVRRYRDRTPEPASEDWPEPLETVLRRRGSVRDFAPAPVPHEELAAILARALAPIPADVKPCTEVFGIVNAVDGLTPGAYRFLAPDRFELLEEGDFRLHAGYLVLEQSLGALSAATLFFMADLDAVLARHDNRGYRWAQLEAGIRTGRVYLAATAAGLGATASTFYDQDVSRVFRTHLSPMLCVAVGHRA